MNNNYNNYDYDDEDDEEYDPFYGYDEDKWYEIEDKIDNIKSIFGNKFKFEKILFTLEKHDLNEERAINYFLNEVENNKKKNEEKKKKLEEKKIENKKKENIKNDKKNNDNKQNTNNIKRKYSKQDSNNEEFILDEKINNNNNNKKEKINENIKRKNSKKNKNEIVEEKFNYNKIYPNAFKPNDIKNIKNNNINIVICGHVDAGKSTLLGQIFYLLKNMKDHLLKKLEKEAISNKKKSFKYAYFLDEREDERQKGITIEVNNKVIEFKGKKFSFLDTPGHKDFIPQMIKGACQADYALLLVEATKNGFLNGFNKGGQTIEHANIINSMGVKNIIIAINKMDVVNWNKEDFEFIKKKMMIFFEKYNFTHFQKFIFVPISAFKGENIIDRKNLDWYKGDCLFEILDKLDNSIHEDSCKPLRAQITSIEEYSVGKKKGTVLTCKIFGGILKKNNKILISPNDIKTNTNLIFIDNEEENSAICGNICEIVLDKKLNLKEEIKVGNIISSIDYPIPIVKKFRAKIFLSELNVPITKGSKFIFFFGSSSKCGFIKRFKYLFDNQTGNIISKNPRIINSFDNCFVEIEMEDKVLIECFKNYKFFSRFQIREEFNVIGFGFIEEIIN